MTTPDYQAIMLPLLQFLSDGKEHMFAECTSALANTFNLSDEDRSARLPSGTQERFRNRVGWAKFYLSKAALVKTIKRGSYAITERGLEVLKRKPATIDNNFLTQFSDFTDFIGSYKNISKENTTEINSDISKETPEEILENSYMNLRADLASELLQTVKDCTPEFFEKLVIDLLIAMGYGGSRRDAGQAIGRSGDEGIDGIIKEDKLGLDAIYIQAKRWANGTVGRPEIQKFAGALQGQRANKGIFITTSTFSKDAHEYVRNIGSKIILIDGEKLSELMIDFNIGVSVVSSYEIKKIDSDYFEEE